MINTCFPHDIRFIDHDVDDDAILTFGSVGEVEAHFRLDEPLSQDWIDDILRIGADGIVHACLCPFSQDVHDERCLMISHDASALDREAWQAAQDI